MSALAEAGTEPVVMWEWDKTRQTVVCKRCGIAYGYFDEGGFEGVFGFKPNCDCASRTQEAL
jgi:hypothetical protein